MSDKRAVSPIGKRLQAVRERVGVPARELDRLADITEGHTSLIETGVVARVTVDTVSKLARALGVTTDWLIDGAGKEPSDRAIRLGLESARDALAKKKNAKPAA